jgi:hypothetical protein
MMCVSFDGTKVRFIFGIPHGAGGSDGTKGSEGPLGEVHDMIFRAYAWNEKGNLYDRIYKIDRINRSEKSC